MEAHQFTSLMGVACRVCVYNPGINDNDNDNDSDSCCCLLNAHRGPGTVLSSVSRVIPFNHAQSHGAVDLGFELRPV